MRKRTPSQIIGHDAITQLAFEGYEVVPIVEKNAPMMNFEISEETKAALKEIDYMQRNGFQMMNPGAIILD